MQLLPLRMGKENDTYHDAIGPCRLFRWGCRSTTKKNHRAYKRRFISAPRGCNDIQDFSSGMGALTGVDAFR